MSRRSTALLAVLVLTAGLSAVAEASSGRAGTYIVVLRDSVDDPRSVAREHARAQGATLGHVYEHALKGYSATMSDVAAARLAADPRVRYVEADGVVHKWAMQTPVTWGLDRIDQRALPLSDTYTYEPTGAGVRAYIIDSGIDTTHPDFGGRAVSGVDKVDNDSNSADCDGHGTHVAGTVGSSTYGVAKGVTLVGVRVLNCSGSGTWSGVIAGVDWVTADHAAGAPAVANMSLGGGYSASVNDAVTRSIDDGVTYAVAAGNGDQAGKAQDACGRSPASTPGALTVGATNGSDAKASWSNYGTCLDLFAPGVSITSTTMGGGTATWSGTSMATPHVAGVAALYLQGNTAALPATVGSVIIDTSTTGVVSGAGTGSPNRLLFSGLAAPVVTPDPSPAPGEDPGSFTLTATGRKVKSAKYVDLTWAGAKTNVDVYRNGAVIALNTTNDGAYTDAIGGKGGGTFVYKVCETGTATCSNEATVIF